MRLGEITGRESFYSGGALYTSTCSTGYPKMLNHKRTALDLYVQLDKTDKARVAQLWRS